MANNKFILELKERFNSVFEVLDYLEKMQKDIKNGVTANSPAWQIYIEDDESGNTHKFSFIGYINIIANDEDEARTKLDDLADIPEMIEIWDINLNDSETVESDCGFGIEAKRYFFDFTGFMKITAETPDLALEKLNEVLESNKLTVENITLEN